MTTKEKIEVMQAYENGKKVQRQRKMSIEWVDTANPVWDWVSFDYRIKPELKYRPYKDIDEMVEDFNERFNLYNPKNTMPFIWLKGKYTGFVFLITVYGETTVAFTTGVHHELKELFKDFEYLDGTPCGKLVEE